MFTVYYKSTCPHSLKALDALDKEKLEYKKFEGYETPHHAIPGDFNTFPKILYNHEKRNIFIGGNSELQELLDLKNKLRKDSTTKISPLKYLTKKQICLTLFEIICHQ
jgi:glutaredoxin